MISHSEIIALSPFSDGVVKLREAARLGNSVALKKYVYWTAWQAIQRDHYIPSDKKKSVFKELLKADLVNVELAANG